MDGENAQAECTKTSELFVLFNGYSDSSDRNNMKANCSCVLIKGPQNVIVDTRTAWNGTEIIQSLHKHKLEPKDIHYVICTHGHSDHIGCNYLFQDSIHIVGYSISHKDTYFLTHDFSKGDEYIINNQVKIVATPGHTLQDITVIFEREDSKIIAVTGDLFEKAEDLQDEQIWISAGSDSENLQRENRAKILAIADYIVPGHGPMFQVSKS